MRLPASITAQPPDDTVSSHRAAMHVDPTEVSDVEAVPTAAERQPWWVGVPGVIVGSGFASVAAVLIAVTGAVYVGMVHAPWVRSLASRTPTAAQAGEAVGAAMAAALASSAPPASGAIAVAAAPAAQPESPAQPASPDRVATARDRMEQRIYSQLPPRARTVAENKTMNDGTPTAENDDPASSSPRRHHRGTRQVRHGAHWNAGWYKGA